MAAAVGINAAVGCTAAVFMAAVLGIMRLLKGSYGVFSDSDEVKHIVHTECWTYGLIAFVMTVAFYSMAASDCDCGNGERAFPKESLSFALSLAHMFGHAITMALTTYAVLAYRHFIIYKDAKRNADEASRLVRAYKHVSSLVGSNPDPEIAGKLARHMTEADKLAVKRIAPNYSPLRFDPPGYLFVPFVVLRVCVMILTMYTMCWLIGG